MLKNIYPWSGNNDFIFYYSSTRKKIKQIETGELYDDAVDPYPSEYHYEETEIPIDSLYAISE